VTGLLAWLRRRVYPSPSGLSSRLSSGLPVQIDGTMPPFGFLVSTSRHGLLLFDGGRLTELLHGECYGLTNRGSWWYAYRRVRAHGQIVRFHLEGCRARSVQIVLHGLNYGIHQVDFIEGRLVLVDTVKNRLLIYDGADALRGRSWQCWSWQVYPTGVREVADFRRDRLRCTRDSPHYRHFNSVFARGSEVYLVAHNRTRSSGRRSELYVLDRDLAPREIRDLRTAEVHNYWTDGQQEIICASAKGTLRVDGVDVAQFGTYTRGLSVGPDHILVGGSQHAAQRWGRDEGDGRVHVLDRSFRVLGRLTIPGTQVHEVRRVDGYELALSDAVDPAAGRVATM
jgi:hypothetical protein